MVIISISHRVIACHLRAHNNITMDMPDLRHIMINTLSNLYSRISLIVMATHHTHACGTHAILGLDTPVMFYRNG